VAESKLRRIGESVLGFQKSLADIAEILKELRAAVAELKAAQCCGHHVYYYPTTTWGAAAVGNTNYTYVPGSGYSGSIHSG
jgi:hypothetical protein